MIRVEGISKFFGTKVVLYSVSYQFPAQGRVALVGANGAGKTTLLDILCGLLESDAGIIIKPARLELGYLPQEPNPHPLATVTEECLAGGAGSLQALYRAHQEALRVMSEQYTEENHRRFERLDDELRLKEGYSLEAQAKAILVGLGFRQEMLEANPASLSGGWRMRLELAKVLLGRPNFLILDEPTNHLDLPSLVWVEKWLQAFPGTLLFVSHDRSLLERLPTITLHLQQGKLTPYTGGFSDFLEERERRMEQEAAVAESLRRRREHLEKFVTRFGAKASKASQAQSKLKMIARIKDLESGVVQAGADETISLQLKQGEPAGREVFKITGGAIGYSTPLATKINLTIERGQKIAVIGANGIGKSTLLKTMSQVIKPLDGEFQAGLKTQMAYFSQDQIDTLDEQKSALDNLLHTSAAVSEKEGRHILGHFLFRGGDVFKEVKVLSGGEKARVGLACLLAKRSNFLLLDEPTNHLDLSSIEILSQALSDYEGTCMFVSHDRTFIDAVCTHVFVMLPGGRSQLFTGKLDDYSRMAALSGFPDVFQPETKITESPTKGAAAAAPARQANRDRQKAAKRCAQLETQMAAMQEEIKSLQHEMEHLGTQFSRLTELQLELEKRQQALAQLENEWLELSES